jgi:hypothetical protein
VKAAFDLSKNAAGVVLKAFKDSVAEGRTIAHQVQSCHSQPCKEIHSQQGSQPFLRQVLLTKSMDLLSTLLLEDNATIRCAAAEAFGFLARATVGHYRESCINFLINCMRSPKREPVSSREHW